MPTFIVLSTLTDDGAETLVKNPERIKEVNQELERDFGVRVVAQYAVLGPYDFVNVVEAEDAATVAARRLRERSAALLWRPPGGAVQAPLFIVGMGNP